MKATPFIYLLNYTGGIILALQTFAPSVLFLKPPHHLHHHHHCCCYVCWVDLRVGLAWQAWSSSFLIPPQHLLLHLHHTTVCFSAYSASFFFAFVPLAKGIKCDGRAIIHLYIIPSQASKIFAVFLQKNFYTASFSFWSIIVIIISITAHITSDPVHLST